MSEVDPDSVLSIGERLKTTREAKKMSLAEIAEITRIPIRHLQNIENDEWDALPATTYSIGFTRSYANAIGLDGNQISTQLREQIGVIRLTHEIPQSYYEPADPARVPPKSLAIIAGIVALILIIGYIIWRSLTVSDTAEIQPRAVTPSPANAAPASSQPQSAASSTPAATGPVVLTATDEVWIRVYEGGSGALIHESILHAGQRFEVPSSAVAPQLHTGRPEALQVTVGAIKIPPLGQPEQTINNVSLLPEDLVSRAQNAVPISSTTAPAITQ